MKKSQEPMQVNRWHPLIWGMALLALLTPWVAMQFTTEVNWQVSDFVVFGCMLLVACSAYEMGTRLSKAKPYRLAMGITVAGSFFLVWANLAVGILGNEGNPANLAFFIIPAIGVVCATIARFKPRGMAIALVAMAAAQVLISAYAFMSGGGNAWVISSVFVLVWLAAASLFHRAKAIKV